MKEYLENRIKSLSERSAKLWDKYEKTTGAAKTAIAYRECILLDERLAELNDVLAHCTAQLQQHNVSGWRPPYGKIETAAKKHASEILGIPPNEVRDDDTIVNGFLAGVEWWVFGAACR